jgi:preprotein translocase subunit SecD
MARRNRLLFFVVLILFVLALLILFPIDKGILGGKGIRLGLDLQGGTRIIYQADLSSIEQSEWDSAIDGAITVLERRVNPLGVSESSIRRLGSDQILVELPGVSLTDAEKESLGRVDILTFGELVTGDEEFKWENELGKWKPATAVIDGQEKELTSQYFQENTYVTQNTLGNILLVFKWNEEGSKISEAVTTELLGKRLGIFEGDQTLRGEDGDPIAPTVQAVITGSGQIEGLIYNDATRLSKQLNYGRLPVPLERTGDEKNVEPWLGEDFVSKSVSAGLIGILAVMLFMIIYYRVSGLMASLALVYYAVLTLAIFKLVGVTLTLAGIGGFVLSVGMAIDANVLIFERMKEELRGGRSLGAAIDAGFSRAWPAIFDSNVTTILAGAILYWLGSSSIVASDMAKGFAMTLIIGVVVSMFTAITVTRTLLRPFVGTGLARRTSLFAPHQRRANV